jgi:hypothetical protein
MCVFSIKYARARTHIHTGMPERLCTYDTHRDTHNTHSFSHIHTHTGVPERLLAYAKTVAHFPTALKVYWCGEGVVWQELCLCVHVTTYMHTHTYIHIHT